jgi:hypothetical protein
LTYIIPIIDSSNLVKKVALVDSKNKIVALGDDTNAALQELKKLREAVGLKKA